MLKKLVKCGNSSALVLDRTILSLLGIEEGGVVRLRIEGDTLLVKASTETKQTDALQLEMENLANPKEPSAPDPKLQAAFKEIGERYPDVLEQLNSQAFLKDLERLNRKYKGNTLSQDFVDEVLALRLKHAPRAAAMDAELKKAATKLHKGKSL